MIRFFISRLFVRRVPVTHWQPVHGADSPLDPDKAAQFRAALMRNRRNAN